MGVEQPPVEIRVHGVGGPQGHRILGEREVDDVVTIPPFRAPNADCGDDFEVPENGETAFLRRVGDTNRTEAYEWGGLTTGSWAKALWILYLPFTILNAAGWAHHWVHSDAEIAAAADAHEHLPSARWAARVHIVAAHVLAALGTLTYVLWIGYCILELLAVRWRHHVIEPGKDGKAEVAGIALDAARAWLPVLASLLFVAVVAAVLGGPVRKGRFEEVGGVDDGGWPLVPRISDRTFFAKRTSHRRRLRTHVALATAVATAVMVQYAAGWNRLGLAIMVTAFTQAAVLVVLLVADVYGRLRYPPPGVAGDVPGVWRPSPRMPSGTVFALVGTAFTHAAFAGSALLLRHFLARWPDKDDPEVLDVSAELGSADVMGWAVLLTVLVIVLIAMLPKRPDAEATVVVKLARRASLLGVGLLIAVAAPTAVYVLLNVSDMGLGGNPLLWWDPFVDWYDRYTFRANAALQHLGGSVLVALPTTVYAILWRPRNRGPARIVGNLWDVLTFWPRRFHPLAAPPSAERAVPELRARIERTLCCERCVVVVAHSQGSVLAAAAIASARPTIAGRGALHLVTFGSPLGTLFGPTWPAYVPPLVDAVRARVAPAPGWVNFWRTTDPVGAGVPGAANQAIEGPQQPTADVLEDAANRRPLERPRRWHSTSAHSHYLTDEKVRTAIDDRRKACKTAPPAPAAPVASVDAVQWAHQGGGLEAPANTVAAMSRARKLSPHTALEFDVHRTSDGRLVVIHDRTTGRTTNANWRVRRRTLDELTKLDAAHYWGTEWKGRPDCRLPSFEAVLDAAHGRLITIEVKAWRAAPLLADKLARLSGDDQRSITVTSFWDPVVRRLRQQMRSRNATVGFAPGIGYTVWFLLRVKCGCPPREAPYQRLQIPIHKLGLTFGTRRLVRAAQSIGMAVDVWTINDRMTMEWAICELGVDGVMTDWPTVLRGTVEGLNAPSMNQRSTARLRRGDDVPEKRAIEVRPQGGEWVVARQGSTRALSKHPTQKEAEPVGRDRARKDKVEFILKGRDGQIRKKDSYGSDPRRAKG